MKSSVLTRILLSALALAASGCAPMDAVDEPKVGPGTELPARFTALGTEPFWAIEVDGAALLYKTPEDREGRRVALTRRVVDGQLQFAGDLSGEPLVLRIAAGTCSDGMSDNVYPFSADLRIGRQTLLGCARAR